MSNQDNIPPFSNWLRQQRKTRGWSQEDLEKQAFVGIRSIQRWEAGKRPPTKGSLENVLKTLEIDVPQAWKDSWLNKNPSTTLPLDTTLPPSSSSKTIEDLHRGKVPVPPHQETRSEDKPYQSADCSSVDVCIVCALPEEARAFLKIVQEQYEASYEKHTDARYKYEYRLVTLQNHSNESLKLHVSWLPRYGPQEMVLHLPHVLEIYQPRVAIMTGICAGDIQHVQLGDLVIAERTFTYDNGKFTLDEHGRSVHLHDTMTYQLDANILQFLGLFDEWKPLVERLECPPSRYEIGLKRREVRCHIKAMASGNAVRADNPFKDVQAPVHGTIAIDMEGAAFGLVMSRHPLIPWMVVKGVCDYADRDKNDAYHAYAAQASALYALSFIGAYVTNERMPRAVLTQPQATKSVDSIGKAQMANADSSPVKAPIQPTHSPLRIFFSLGLIFLLLLGGPTVYFWFHPIAFSPPSTIALPEGDVHDDNLEVSLLPLSPKKATILPDHPANLSTNELPNQDIPVLLLNHQENDDVYRITLSLTGIQQSRWTIVIEHVELLVDNIFPLPSPLNVWVHSPSTTYAAYLYRAQYQGQHASEQIWTKFSSPTADYVTITPKESEKISVQINSNRIVNFSFKIQVTYTIDNDHRTLMLPHVFQVIFTSNRHEYQLKDGHFVELKAP
jgi:nucleoside phosphorylase/transcriptional regulator with XRE-family HTH domain